MQDCLSTLVVAVAVAVVLIMILLVLLWKGLGRESQHLQRQRWGLLIHLLLCMRLIMELVALEGGYGTKLGNSNADDVKVDKPSKNRTPLMTTLVVQGKRSV